jgi:hypothetical protein
LLEALIAGRRPSDYHVASVYGESPIIMSAVEEKAVLAALPKFADAVTAKMTSVTMGEPEDQLRSPFEIFMQDLGRAIAREVVCTGETRLPNRLGKPDYAVHSGKILIGYVELKAPGIGATTSRFTGRNADQYWRFSAIPSLIHCHCNAWPLYYNCEPVRPAFRLTGDLEASAKSYEG